jgi:predicted Zn finger-like uncharacterized protein
MALATKCPHCNTVFRVAADQLKLRGGIVRCGHCKEVFDGNAFLIDPLAPGKPPVSSAGRVPVRPTPLPTLISADPAPAPAAPPPVAAPSAPVQAADSSTASLLRAASARPVVQETRPVVQQTIQQRIQQQIQLDRQQERQQDASSVIAVAEVPGIAAQAIASQPAEPAKRLLQLEALEPLAAPAAPEAWQTPEATETPALPDAQEAPSGPQASAEVQQAEEAEAFQPAQHDPALLPPLKLDFDLDLDLDLDRTAVTPPEAVAAAIAPEASSPAQEPEPDEPPPFALPSVRTEQPVRKPLRSRGSRRTAEIEPEHQPDPDGPRSLLQKASAAPVAPPPAPSARAFFAKPLTVAREPVLLREEDGMPSMLPGRPDPVLEELIELENAALAAPALEPVERTDDAVAEPLAEVVDAPDEPAFVRQGRRRERTSKKLRMWLSAGSAVLGLVLVAQGLTTFRNELAAQVPQIKPLLVAACGQLGCQVELPADIEMISVEQGELQALGETTFSYSTLLRNQSRSAQVWPSIELILNDNYDKPVLRRVFAPKEYLPAHSDVSKGFPAQSEQSVKLYFELAQLKASGYHIAIFYP